ncbi:MAG TPA: squalene--hopene cyclase [Polyangia bacterium]|jgi:squalene-hopene/tetraprenyl-beta-curcumene cyclase
MEYSIQPSHLSRLSALGPARVEQSMTRARDWLLARQEPEGFWCAELEGDTTLESYMILLEAFFGRRGSAKSLALARTIREEALAEGGWAQYAGGPPEVSVSCLSYLALKIAGDAAEAPHMRRAREAIARLGGAERANTYTKYHFALFGQYPWTAVPAIPPEMVFLPRGAPFTVYDMSAWSRTIFVPLSILYATKPVCALPPAAGVGELFTVAPGTEENGKRGGWKRLFFGVDSALKVYERVPGVALLRKAALAKAARWMTERLEDSDGLSAILPAMANSVMALKCLGYEEGHPLLKEQLGYLDGLLLRGDDGALRMQPCLSPVWDTVLSGYALAQAGVGPDEAPLRKAASWLLAKQCRRPGDWQHRNPAPPGGWFFEYRNEFYPDVDDTCMALLVLQNARAMEPEHVQRAAMERGLTWMLGMQNSDGGWASFDRDNDKQWLTEVPFADHNAMIDPSTADITARVLECLATFPGFGPESPVVRRAVAFLHKDQMSDGSWYGRWGVNHIYGTWQVLRGLRCIGEDMQSPPVRRAVRWFLNHQNSDGGWGESVGSYDDPALRGVGASTPSQTAWALMGLLAAGEGDEPAVQNGVRYLLERQDEAGTWAQPLWSGTGFPKVFYLNYHYYRHYFPLMALGQYRADRRRPLNPVSEPATEPGSEPGLRSGA